ncbi:hypothetical protein Scep_012544 [Stephania cephalantha]|uniref:Uncharacterized protein n=1 Tax=Stephania cephalantha TaxID=152367 RepID=A0AAP0P9Y4_9MAGN
MSAPPRRRFGGPHRFSSRASPQPPPRPLARPRCWFVTATAALLPCVDPTASATARQPRCWFVAALPDRLRRRLPRVAALRRLVVHSIRPRVCRPSSAPAVQPACRFAATRAAVPCDLELRRTLSSPELPVPRLFFVCTANLLLSLCGSALALFFYLYLSLFASS